MNRSENFIKQSQMAAEEAIKQRSHILKTLKDANVKFTEVGDEIMIEADSDTSSKLTEMLFAKWRREGRG